MDQLFLAFLELENVETAVVAVQKRFGGLELAQLFQDGFAVAERLDGQRLELDFGQRDELRAPELVLYKQFQVLSEPDAQQEGLDLLGALR